MMSDSSGMGTFTITADEGITELTEYGINVTATKSGYISANGEGELSISVPPNTDDEEETPWALIGTATLVGGAVVGLLAYGAIRAKPKTSYQSRPQKPPPRQSRSPPPGIIRRVTGPSGSTTARTAAVDSLLEYENVPHE